MLSSKMIREMMEMSLRSPMDLADRLGQKMSPYQYALMESFMLHHEALEVTESPALHTIDAVGVCMLWRLLSIPGSKGIVIASSERLESVWTDYMMAITKAYDPAVAAMCRWTRSNTMKLGDQAGGELRLMRNIPGYISKASDDVTTWVVLGAGCTDVAFAETRTVVDSYRGYEGHKHLIVW